MSAGKDSDASQGMDFLQSMPRRWVTIYIPIVLFVAVIFASQMIATAIATEKENKTLETLLSYPVTRTSIVTSKMLDSFFGSEDIPQIAFVQLIHFAAKSARHHRTFVLA